MKKNKGFTLIELLTVIAILAVILLIAAPTILGVLDKAKKNTFKNQVLLYVEGLKQQVALASIGTSDMTITLPTEGKTIEVDITKIPMDTNPGFTGNIIVENKGNGKYTYTLSNVASSDYKVNGNVLANELTVDNIIKASETTTPSEPETPVTYAAYLIGDEVTLKDGSVWYVIENSDSSNDTVTLFASQNIKYDASGWTTTRSEYAIAFDTANARTTANNSYCTSPEYGCNIYAANGSTVTEDSTIKEFIDGSVKTFINNSLTSNGGTNIKSIRLITTDEYSLIKSNTWSYSTYYWTMTPYASIAGNVYSVYTDSGLDFGDAHNGSNHGARPVITTLKSNIQ